MVVPVGFFGMPSEASDLASGVKDETMAELGFGPEEEKEDTDDGLKGAYETAADLEKGIEKLADAAFTSDRKWNTQDESGPLPGQGDTRQLPDEAGIGLNRPLLPDPVEVQRVRQPPPWHVTARANRPRRT